MKTGKRLLAWLAALGVVCSMGGAALAASGTVSAESSASQVVQGDTVTITVAMEKSNVSSLGVQITCDEGLQVQSGQWVQSGLMASFDMATNKGVFSPGGAKDMEGDVFQLKVKAAKASAEPLQIAIKLIGKNSTQTVFEETVRKTIRVGCTEHSFGDYTAQSDGHSRVCSDCGQTQSQKHSFNTGVVSREPDCTQPGSKTYTCKTCGYSKEEAVSALGHKISEWIVDRQPAVGVEGSKHKECTVCGVTLQTASIPALEPPATEPPATEPPATEPPATEPPATEPPATEPPATEPPATEPPATEPPATEPPATEPPATEPPATEPPAQQKPTQKPTQKPEQTEPPATEPEVTEPEVTEPEVTEPEVTEPEATEPGVTEPEATEPEVTEPSSQAPVKENKKTNSVWKLVGVAVAATCVVASVLLFWRHKK